jgi:tetratricopeptide (TPR) repeat protein
VDHEGVRRLVALISRVRVNRVRKAGYRLKVGRAGSIAVLALLASVTSDAAGPSEPSAVYLEAVERYRRGDLGVVGEDWPSAVPEGIEALKRAQAQARKCRDCAARKLIDAFPFEAAAMLHTDRDEWERGRVQDVEEVLPGRAPHLDAARQVLELIPDEARRRRFEGPWALAVALYLFRRGQWPLAEDHLDWALRRHPDDPHLLLARGSLLESHVAVEKARGARAGAPPGTASRDRQEWDYAAELHRRLRQAEGYYRRALRASPDLFEARVRLGRVLHQSGQPGRAVAELTATAARPEADPRMLHLTYLFLGAAQEADGRPREAVEAYRTAIALQPESQPAHVALSHVLHDLGERVTSRDVLRGAVVEVRRRNEWDPWWNYRWGQAMDAEGRLEALREQATR